MFKCQEREPFQKTSWTFGFSTRGNFKRHDNVYNNKVDIAHPNFPRGTLATDVSGDGMRALNEGMREGKKGKSFLVKKEFFRVFSCKELFL